MRSGRPRRCVHFGQSRAQSDRPRSCHGAGRNRGRYSACTEYVLSIPVTSSANGNSVRPFGRRKPAPHPVGPQGQTRLASRQARVHLFPQMYVLNPPKFPLKKKRTNSCFFLLCKSTRESASESTFTARNWRKSTARPTIKST
jgi:hypothetical protein